MDRAAPRTIAGEALEIASLVAEWITEEIRRGARLFSLEGLMKSGKSHLVMQLEPLIAFSSLTLDDFLAPEELAWEDSIHTEAAHFAVQELLAGAGPVIVEGAVAWPTVAPLCTGVETRRLYLKRMQFPTFWADEAELTECMPQQTFRRSVRDYHATTRPWEVADLVIERLVTEFGE